MRKITKVLALTLALALTLTVCEPIANISTVSVSAATSDSVSYGALTANTPLRLAAKDSALIYKIYPKGTGMQILSSSGNYYCVKIDGKTGYVPKSSTSNYNATVTDSVNMRSGPGTKNEVLAVVPNGNRIYVISKKNYWSYVYYKGQKGWIINSYIKNDTVYTATTVSDTVASFNTKASMYVSSDASSTRLGTYNIGTEAKILSLGLTWTKVNVGENSGYVQTKYLRRGNATIKVRGTQLRKSASSSATSLATLYSEDRVTILKQDTQWTQVIAAGVKGYVPTSTVSKDKVYTSSTEETNSIYSTTASVSLKSESGSVLETLPKGTEVTLISKSGSNYLVKANGTTGYVPSSKLQTGNAVTIANDVPFKSAAGDSARTIRTLNKGVRISVLSSTGSWSRVMVGDISGYIQTGLYQMDYTEDTDISPNSSLMFTSCSTGLYKSTSTKSGTVATLSKGTVVTKVAKSSSGNFYKVVSNGKIGYVLANALYNGNAMVCKNGTQLLSSASATASVKTTLKVYSKVTILSESGNFYYVKCSNQKGYILKPYVFKIVKNYHFKKANVKSLTTNAKLRKSSSNSSAVIKTLNSGTSVTVIETGSKYTKVAYGNYIGYVLTEAFRSYSSGRTNMDLKLYSSVDDNHSTLAYIPSGSNVSIIKDYDDNWMQIKYGNKTGYVLSTYVDRTKASEYTWKTVNGYQYAYDVNGNRVRDVSDLVSGPYKIITYKYQCITVVYARSSSGDYNIPVKAMICSPGYTTPEGTYYSPAKYRWLQMVGDTWAQWTTDIIGNYLYHTVPDWTQSNLDLEVDEFNHLGTIRSLGCVRLLASDCKWIYDNTSAGQEIVITAANASPVDRPANITVPSWHSWDPTDPTAHYKCLENGCH
jgi:uncharacterized protein YgiM (DUF1202 family)